MLQTLRRPRSRTDHHSLDHAKMACFCTGLQRALMAGGTLSLLVACSNSDGKPDEQLALEWRIDSVPTLSIADEGALDSR